MAATCPEGRVLKPEMFREDATRYALSFCRDARALHGHNHDHSCSFTCIKYVKDNAKSIAKESMGTMTNIVCRFFFYVVLVFTIIEDGVERVKQVRRRGKELIKKPYVASINVRNELGRVQVERHTPFRGATADVGQNGARCNFDLQFMPRAPVLADVIRMMKRSRSRLAQARSY